MRQRLDFVISISAVAASEALAARLAEARKAMALLRQLVAALRIADLNRLSLLGGPDDPARWVEGLPKEPDCPNDLQHAQ